MATHINIVLDTRRMRSDEKYPIILRIIHNRKSTSIPLNYSIYEKDWNESKQLIKSTCKTHPNIKRLNNLLSKKKADALDIITKLEDEKRINEFELVELKRMISGKENKYSLYQLSDKVIEENVKASRIGNAAFIRDSINVIKKYRNGKDITFEQINFSFLKNFETYYREKGNSVNSLGVRMRAIRLLYNRAINERIIDSNKYPFKNYKIKYERTKKRSLKKSEIDSIIALDVSKNQDMKEAKDYFLFSFYLMGISFADMAQLKVSNIHDDRIFYKRGKTKKEYSIKVTEQLRTLLEPYIKGKSKDEFILPVIKRNDDPILMRKDIRNATKLYNKKLKKLAELCGIEDNLTSYYSRHSWATIAKRMGISTEIISEGLGHESLKTTQIYLDSFGDKVLDNANELITG